MNRWGPNSKEMAAIKKYLDTQNVTINASNHPMVSGVEIDLPALYHAVQSLGGLTEVIQKKKWGKIAEFLRVPKGTQDRSNKFYDIYCKFLLPYDTLSKVEREELFKLGTSIYYVITFIGSNLCPKVSINVHNCPKLSKIVQKCP